MNDLIVWLLDQITWLDRTWFEADVCQFALHVVGAGVEQVQVRPQPVQLTLLSTQALDLLSRQPTDT